MGDVASAAWTAGATLIAVFLAATTVGFWLLFRRTRGKGTDAQAKETRHANILLVRADDAVRDAADELDFAIAQFGTAKTGDLSRALAEARRRVLEAFALQQRLDDHVPDTGAQRRDWTARIVHLCETAQSTLNAELARFDELRELDKNAPANLAELRRQLEQLSHRQEQETQAYELLTRSYSPAALASVTDNLEQAADANAAAVDAADTADAALTSASVADAIDAIRDGQDHARRAGHLLDAIESLAAQLGTASAAMQELIDSTRTNLDEARAVRDSPPDAAAGASVITAVSQVETVLASLDASDPVATLDRLREANASLDTSLAGARNQARRLEGAREALAGALVSASSQLSATRDFIAARRGQVGSAARTRLAESERLLAVAEAEADPVMALDTARSAATHARDADALARYDLRR